jgi:hypothetical protein
MSSRSGPPCRPAPGIAAHQTAESVAFGARPSNLSWGRTERNGSAQLPEASRESGDERTGAQEKTATAGIAPAAQSTEPSLRGVQRFTELVLGVFFGARVALQPITTWQLGNVHRDKECLVAR